MVDYNKILAEVYTKLLNIIEWNDALLVSGINEGKNKFLSNVYLKLINKKSKYYKTHYISKTALIKLRKKEYSELIFEHMIPKRKYIEIPCENLAAKGKLTKKFVRNVLNNYWFIATITKIENKKLQKHTMPNNWDKVDIFARYTQADIKIIKNPYFL